MIRSYLSRFCGGNGCRISWTYNSPSFGCLSALSGKSRSLISEPSTTTLSDNFATAPIASPASISLAHAAVPHALSKMIRNCDRSPSEGCAKQPHVRRIAWCCLLSRCTSASERGKRYWTDGAEDMELKVTTLRAVRVQFVERFA